MRFDRLLVFAIAAVAACGRNLPDEGTGGQGGAGGSGGGSGAATGIPCMPNGGPSCPDGTACSIVCDGTATAFQCVTAGTAGPGEDCSTVACAAGSLCVNQGASRCRKYCNDFLDCGTGKTCQSASFQSPAAACRASSPITGKVCQL